MLLLIFFFVVLNHHLYSPAKSFVFVRHTLMDLMSILGFVVTGRAPLVRKAFARTAYSVFLLSVCPPPPVFISRNTLVFVALLEKRYLVLVVGGGVL